MWLAFTDGWIIIAHIFIFTKLVVCNYHIVRYVILQERNVEEKKIMLELTKKTKWDTDT